jgi:hypothetical protein
MQQRRTLIGALAHRRSNCHARQVPFQTKKMIAQLKRGAALGGAIGYPACPLNGSGR